jgi:hypothetical protein
MDSTLWILTAADFFSLFVKNLTKCVELKKSSCCLMVLSYVTRIYCIDVLPCGVEKACAYGPSINTNL